MNPVLTYVVEKDESTGQWFAISRDTYGPIHCTDSHEFVNDAQSEMREWAKRSGFRMVFKSQSQLV